MATSGVSTFTMTAIQVINKAFSKIGVKTAEQELEADEYQDGQDSLNLMIKAWGAQGLHLWCKEEGLLFLDAGKSNYNLGLTGDEACELDDFIGTDTTAAYVATDTDINVTSVVGMVTGDYVGIELDDNTRHWTTIASTNNGPQIILTDGLPSGSKLGSTVFTFTSLIQRPNRILSYRRKTYGNDSEIPVSSLSRNSYFNQVNKLQKGTVVNCYYSPQLGNGVAYVWQTASSVNDLLRFTYERPMEDILTGEDNVDFPVEWLETVIYNLAARLVDDYNVPIPKADRIVQKAAFLLDELLGWDEEMESIYLQPDFD